MMNEQIQKLAEQAGAEIYGHKDFATICVNGKDADDLMKKFAELIVRECAKVNNEFIGRRIGEIDLDMVYKEHFGVEE